LTITPDPSPLSVKTLTLTNLAKDSMLLDGKFALKKLLGILATALYGKVTLTRKENRDNMT
jgi:hypothetical protein